MRIRVKNLVAVGIVLAGGGLATVGGSDAAVKKCKPTQVALTIAGKRTCVARTRFRPARSPRPEIAALVGDTLARPINATRKRDKRRVVLRPVPASLARLATAKAVELEAATRIAVAAAFAAKSKARLRRAADGPAVTVTNNADGSVTGSASASVSSGGNTATVKVEMNGHVVGGEVQFDFGVDMTIKTEAGRTSSFGVTFGDLGGTTTASCPTVDGAIRLDGTWSGAARKADVFTAGSANLGTFRSAASIKGKATATARMSPDATLTPFRFAIADRLDIAVSTKALGFINNQARVVATGSLSGTIDPASGQISGGASTINVTTSGVAKDDGVAVRTKARIDMEKSLRDRAGRILKEAKEVEKRAREGQCTKLIFDPATPGSLTPNGNVNVTSRLETVAGDSVQKVKWTATATKGSVTPASASSAQPSWSITGAADGPEVARIPVRAVSPAGISEVPWVGGLAFPPSYSGTVSLSENLGGKVDQWSGTFTWVRSSIQQNPDKSQLARYTLASGSVNPYTVSIPSASGFCTGGSTAPSGTVVFGDLEIFVDPVGAWRSAFVVDVDVADFPITCPPGDTPFPGLYPAGAFLNSRQNPGALLRPMAAAGPITATAVTDVGSPVILSTASWSLQPGT